MNVLPNEFLQSLKGIKGFDEPGFKAVHSGNEKITCVRINPSKIPDGGSPVSVLPAEAAPLTPVPWSGYGYYLSSRPSFTLDPLLHAGAYYVQEPSSMFLEQCIKQSADVSKPLKVLDLCAAPGGKSTLIHSVISNESLLVSNEVIKTRVNILTENMFKWGSVNNIVTNNDPRDFARLKNYFDIIVADAPCSGSGLFRRDPTAIDHWSMETVNLCSQRQQRILADAYPALKKNGVLIYSTCSYSREEDEEICDWLIENFNLETIRVRTEPDWNIIETESNLSNAYGYRFFPDKLKGEGFFISCFRKKDGEEEYSGSGKKNKLVRLSSAEGEIVKPWLNESMNVSLYKLNDEVFAFPKQLEEELADINVTLYTRKAGTMVGRIFGNELVPAHELALTRLANKGLLSISLKKEEALQYLRKEEVSIDTANKGWALVQYRQLNLGWVKLLRNRVNNYYPKEWRILKSGNN